MDFVKILNSQMVVCNHKNGKKYDSKKSSVLRIFGFCLCFLKAHCLRPPLTLQLLEHRLIITEKLEMLGKSS